MKKAILFGLLLFATATVFAQGDDYEERAYRLAARQVKNLEKAKLPAGFYYDGHETHENMENYKKEMTHFSLRVGLFSLIEKAYKKNPDSYNAAFNYANALMQPIDLLEDLGDSPLPANNSNLALAALRKWKETKADDVEMWRILWRAYEYEIFGDYRQNEFYAMYPSYYVNGELKDSVGDDLSGFSGDQVIRIYGDTYEETVNKYRNAFPESKGRLQSFKNLVRLGKEDLLSSDYKEAALICVALHQYKLAKKYFQQAVDLGLFETETENGQLELASDEMLDGLGARDMLNKIRNKKLEAKRFVQNLQKFLRSVVDEVKSSTSKNGKEKSDSTYNAALENVGKARLY